MRRRREKRGFEWALVRLSKSVSDSEELIKSSPKSVSMKGRMSIGLQVVRIQLSGQWTIIGVSYTTSHIAVRCR